ncbi:MAG: DUF6531 domain-containing protein, partial [Chlamydiota bacterium]
MRFIKYGQLIFLILLLPALLYGLSEKECQAIKSQALAEWDRHTQLVLDYQNFGADREGYGLHRLKESLYCCQRALSLIDGILEDIASKPKKKRKKPWRVQMKTACAQDKQTIETEIKRLEKSIDNVSSSMAFEKAKALYEQGLEKEKLAHEEKENRPLCPLLDVDLTVAHLSKVATLYREAEALVKKALHTLLAESSYEEKSKEVLVETIERQGRLAAAMEKEALEWPRQALAQKQTLRKRLSALREDALLFEEKGLKRSAYEQKKQALPLLETLIQNSKGEEKETFEQRLKSLKTSITEFEELADQNRLTETTLPLSDEAFKQKEKVRRETFFRQTRPFLNPQMLFHSSMQDQTRPFALPLDGPHGKKDEAHILYLDQFYRFLVQSDKPILSVRIQVLQDEEILCEETISLPLQGAPSWQSYLTRDALLFIPETTLKKDFGIDLRFQWIFDPTCPFSLVVTQKGTNPGLTLSFSLNEKEPLFFSFFARPPPWQLDALLKPGILAPRKQSKQPPPLIDTSKLKEPSCASCSYPILDQLVEELQNDPLLLAQTVQQEIALVDPYLKQEEGVFQAPGILRNPLMTYLERRGSPWEQCYLLVYLLKKAGYNAYYVTGSPSAIPKDFAEKMLLTKLPEGQREALVKYPFVLLIHEEKPISLFPWMKEIETTEGYDLYNLLPEEYASADRWILRYLKGDENIVKHIGSDGNDTAALLFSRFVGEEVRKQGLSLEDVGIHAHQVKRQFSSWDAFPRPRVQGNHEILSSIESVPNLAAFILVDITSHENPNKHLSCSFPAASLSCVGLPIECVPNGKEGHRLILTCLDKQAFLDLDETDKLIDIKVSYTIPIGSDGFHGIQTLSMAKGTKAALCFHFGGRTSHKTRAFQNQFSEEKDEKKRLFALLAFMGAAYFEKCGYGEELFARLHKTTPKTVFAFGLSKLSPDLSKGPFKDESDLILPQVDMFWFSAQLPSHTLPVMCNEEPNLSHRQCRALTTVNSSSNEHQILREIFSDPYAISTVKLLQLAHLEHQKKEGDGEGFLTLTQESLSAFDQTPDITQTLYFPHLKDVNLQSVKNASPSQWEAMKSLLTNPWSYGYLTPGCTSNQNKSYREMGALILTPAAQYALISNNNLLFHGGLGSPLDLKLFTPQSMRNWQLTPTYTYSGFTHYSLGSLSADEIKSPPTLLKTAKQISDIRPKNKSRLSYVADPVDTITGAFYIDEVDLKMPGDFPLEIRRNFNSQNPIKGSLGNGWKLSLNPFLTEQDGKLFAAEVDGTVLCYTYNSETLRYEVRWEDNPDLYNLSEQIAPSKASLFHSYIKDNVLYGADGSKRTFEDGLLKQWVSKRRVTLTFFYEEEKLSRIESSNGDFLGFHYNPEGTIAEIYVRDGRRISYHYNAQNDLIQVTLPNTAKISYEYDHHHRILRETKPHGNVIENRYDDEGRVIEQRSPMGPAQAMITTATFEYAEGMTTVTDAAGGKTIYKIFQNQIYQVTDPLGNTLFESYFIDEKSYFDAKTEKVTSFEGHGGFPKSLKSATDKRGLTTSYLYDAQGNPIKITLQGEDLTGKGDSILEKTLAYNDRNLCTEETVFDQTTKTLYDQNFPYLPKRIETYSGETRIGFIEFSYNPSGQCIKQNSNGAITLWDYNAKGLAIQKTEKTGTEDPDRITTYAYNHQGQPITIKTPDQIRENAYDIMGNLLESETFSPSGDLLSATYLGYNLRGQPIWKQTANPSNTLYFDYHASGKIKATRQTLTLYEKQAYTLCEYDPRGFLLEEVNPLGVTTFREYDALGNILAETIEGHTTLYIYEPGGLVQTLTSPSGAKTTRHYTTNGLLIEETYPDGTKTSITYDCFGRKTQETKRGITWDITYDNANRSITRTHRETGQMEMETYDAHGNLICFRDRAGFTTEKTYDNLGRIKTEISPSGQKTTWNYLGNKVLCTLPSGETQEHHYAGGQIATSKTFNADGDLIEHSTFHYDPEKEIETIDEGGQVTITWLNALKLPIKVQKGEITTTYEYDELGHCIAIIDGEKRATYQTFDGLGRITQKQLPDGALIEYTYDLDSNLSQTRLPNGNTWQASYDPLGRKLSEKLLAEREASNEWEYTYEEGNLKQATDPMGRIHSYTYDSHRRLIHEEVDGYERTFAYDPRGLLILAEESGPQGHSQVERSYDDDGRLRREAIYLDSTLIQETHQTWAPSIRTLQIGDHERTLRYQNDRLSSITTETIDLFYTYDTSGALQGKSGPHIETSIRYNSSGLPKEMIAQTLQSAYKEKLQWHPSGKLSSYFSPKQEKEFTYTERGYLESAGSETYSFDFGNSGIGTLTEGPYWQAAQLDSFSRAIEEMRGQESLSITYNAMGETTSYGEKSLTWDPWGRLLKVVDPSSTWEAAYDAFGRRLKTRYTPKEGAPLVTISLYDPEEEFQEIGVKQGEKIYWKLYGPDSCDAVIDEKGMAVSLMHNALNQLCAVVTDQGAQSVPEPRSSYGPQEQRRV